MKAFLLFLSGILSFHSLAQDGSLDTSFGSDGMVITDIDNSHDYGWALAQQEDQKLIVSGTMSPNLNFYHPFLVRYLNDGSIDTSFGTDGKIVASHGTGYNGYTFLFTDNEQRILAGGVIGYDSNFVVDKYMYNGILDSSFGDNGSLIIPNTNLPQMTVLDDGSFLILKFSGSNEISVSHYLSNGLLDTAYGIDGTAISNFNGESFTGRKMKVDAGNNIYFLGTRDNFMNTDVILMKFLPTGYLDTSFGNSGMVIKNIDAMNPQNSSSADFAFTNEGKILIAGSSGACINENQSIRQPFFLKYETTGVPDTSFGVNGTVLDPISGFEMEQVFIQTNQKIIVTGHWQECFEGSAYTIQRYYANGYRDYSFSGGMDFEFDYHKTILQEDGKIVSVGNTHWYEGVEDVILIRHNNDQLSVEDYDYQKLNVYPNPSSGIFYIKNSMEGQAYRVFDITGKIVIDGELSSEAQIDLSGFQSGVYFLKLGNNTFRLLKH